MAKRKGKKLNKLDWFLIFDLLLMITFTVVMIIIYLKMQSIPDVLVTCVFGALGGELGIMGWIKSSKEKTEQRKNELADRKYFNKIKGDDNNDDR